MRIRGFSELEQFLEGSEFSTKGCLVDSSYLIAASYDSDIHNTACDVATRALAKSSTPIFTNVSVKHEFMEAQRRIVISEALCDFYTAYGNIVPSEIESKLKSHKTIHQRKIDDKKSTKMELEQIEAKSKLLRPIKIAYKNAWQITCEEFLEPNLSPVWERTVRDFRIQELRTRESDKSKYLNAFPEWEDAIKLMGKHCLGSIDSMIVNMFKCSTLSILLTVDREMARCAVAETESTKVVFIPDAELAKLRMDLAREGNSIPTV